MASTTYSFNKFSFNFAVPFLIVLSFTLVFTSLAIQNKEWSLLIIPAVSSLGLMALIYYSFLGRKVTLTPHVVRFSGVNSILEIQYSEIRSLGVFVQTRRGGKLMHPRDVEKYSIHGVKFIYVSTLESPEFENKPKEGFICFQYRKSAYHEIIDKLKEIETN